MDPLENQENQIALSSKCNLQVFGENFHMDKEMVISININHIIIFMDLFNKIMGFLNDISKVDNLFVVN